MPHDFWASVHGAAVHFPIALTFFALGCDLLAWARWQRSDAAVWRTAGLAALTVAALGSLPAVVSGLWLTHGGLLGTGALRSHHLFAWPAFAGLTGLTVWRLCRAGVTARAEQGWSLLPLAGLAALLAATGHWGGQLAHAFP